MIERPVVVLPKTEYLAALDIEAYVIHSLKLFFTHFEVLTKIFDTKQNITVIYIFIFTHCQHLPALSYARCGQL